MEASDISVISKWIGCIMFLGLLIFFIWIQFGLSLVLTCLCVTWVICDFHANPPGVPKLPRARWVPGHTVGCPTLCPFRINRRSQLGLNWKSTRQRYWSSQAQINIDVTQTHSSLAQNHEVCWREGAKARALGIRRLKQSLRLPCSW